MTTEKRRNAFLGLDLLLGGVLVQAAVFSGSVDQDFGNTANWTGGYPAPADWGQLDRVANLSGATSNDICAVRIGVGEGTTGVLNISDGANLNATAHASWSSWVGGNSIGIVNQTGGTVVLSEVEVGRNTGASGVYNLSGGSLSISRELNGNSLYLGTSKEGTTTATGTFEISGGSLITRGGVYLGSSDGSGVGTFSVVGSSVAQIGIGSNGSLDGSWTQNSNSVLRVRIDTTALGLSRIWIDEVGDDGGGDVTFEAGALLDVGFSGLFMNGGTYTVMEWEGVLTDNGLQFAPGVNTNIWSFNLDSVNRSLQVTAEGEPLVLSEFVHPGITHKLSDLDRMKYMVEAQRDPWYSSYQEMAAHSMSSYDYTVRGDPSFTELGRDGGPNYSAWNSDIRAAYYNALRWYITGDSRHADKSIEIFNAWTNLTSVTSGGTDSLSGGVAYIMIEAAELIKSTYSGWLEEEINAFQSMLVYPGYSTTEKPSGETSFYWMAYQGDPARHGNQGLSGWRTVMAMGIFLDHRIMYDRALRHLTGLPHRPDDLAYPSGPRIRGALTASTEFVDSYSTSSGSSIEDYGFNGVMTHYIWENGQCQESSRDMQHTFFGIGLICSMAEMAWNQGDDLYSHANDRLLLGLEYNMRYNVSDIQSYPDQPSPWVPTVASGEFIQRDDRTLRWFSKAMSTNAVGGFSVVRPVFELPVAHYVGRGFKTEGDVKWTLRARDKAIELSGYEVAGWANDALGWGALTARRPDYCYGDPILGFLPNGLPEYGMHVVPCTIEAENYDYFAVNGEGRTYHDLTSTNTGGAYRSDEGVDITTCSEGGYALTDMEAGEWVSYTVYIPETRKYSLSVHYAATNEGAIRFSFAGREVTTDVILPSTGSVSNWATYTVAQNLMLTNSVQCMRVYVSGGCVELDRMTLAEFESGTIVLTPPEELTASPLSASEIDLTWETTSGASRYNLKRSLVTGGPYEELALGPLTTNYIDSGLLEGTNYYYVINALYNETESVDSSEVSARPSMLIHPDDVVIGSLVIGDDGSGGQQLLITILESGLGHHYRVLSTASLVDPNWENTSQEYLGNGGALQMDVAIRVDEPNLFYRLEAWRQ
ncbi:MAG: carbohydrate-binding domain-containing protein [Pontiella sp.]